MEEREAEMMRAIEPVSSSPLPVPKPKIEITDFFSALKTLMEGKKIRRVSWPEGTVGSLADAELRIFLTSDNQIHRWIVSEGDLLATDWVTL